MIRAPSSRLEVSCRRHISDRAEHELEVAWLREVRGGKVRQLLEEQKRRLDLPATAKPAHRRPRTRKSDPNRARRVQPRVLHDPPTPGPIVRRQPAGTSTRDRRHVPAQGSSQCTDADPDRRQTRDGGSDLRIRRSRRSLPSMSRCHSARSRRRCRRSHAGLELFLALEQRFVHAAPGRRWAAHFWCSVLKLR